MSLMADIYSKNSQAWTGHDENKWLGWLDIVERQLTRLEEFKKIQKEFQAYSYVVLLGMGGSSLCPDVLSKTFKSAKGYPSLLILDSTNPDQIQTLQEKLSLEKTCFIVSSKSGSTLEPNIFLAYFYEQMKKVVGEKAGAHFIAITDPGSQMEKKAKELGFKNIFYGDPSIGGRYSALSDFGIIPGLALGIDMEKFLTRAQLMVDACKTTSADESNPGFVLGKSLGEGALRGLDKISLVASPEFDSFPAWIEQLLAESTGKNGKGLIPVVETALSSPEEFGKDRHFVYCGSNPTERIKNQLSELAQSGHMITILPMEDQYDLGQEFYRWEVATAVAGHILKINPFDQPDVEASKIEARRLTDQFEKEGELPPATPFYSDSEVELFTDAENENELKSGKDLSSILKLHFARLNPHDYAAILAFVEMDELSEEILLQMKDAIQETTHAATALGFGPRFLHSTGQAYKGGPNTGVFLQITTEDRKDLMVPDHKYTFGVVQKAQARGDFQVLVDRKRRALRVHLKKPSALSSLRDHLVEALNKG